MRARASANTRKGAPAVGSARALAGGAVRGGVLARGPDAAGGMAGPGPARRRQPVPLIADEGSKIAKAFGLTRAGGWLPAKRATFVIDTSGVVQRAISAEFDIGEHVRESLAALDEPT